MASTEPPASGLPPSMGPGGRPLQPGENPGSLLKEITEIRSHYSVHLASDAIELAYQLKGQNRNYRLPFDNIPVGGWTRALCYGGNSSTAVTGTLLIDMIRACENMSGRQVTQEEAEGIAYYSSRRMMTMYLGQMGAIGLGLGSAWTGRKNMKFPFIKPKPQERYESFPARVLPILKGRYARVMWHVTRANVYIVMWLFLTQPFVRSIADTRMTVGLYQDRRTHALTQTLKGQFDRLRSNRASEAAARGQQQPQQMVNAQEQDDASPSTFYDSQPFGNDSSSTGDSSFTDGSTDTGLLADRDMQQRQSRQAPPTAWSKAQARGSRTDFDQPNSASSSSSADIFFDDASPTAGNDPDMGTSQGYSRQGSGSAWSRIRKGEGVSQPQRNRPQGNRSVGATQSRDFETRSDSFSFSDSEEDKRLAKEQAQKEFDAMLDRERREGGAADYARDMQATTAGEDSNSRGTASITFLIKQLTKPLNKQLTKQLSSMPSPIESLPLSELNESFKLGLKDVPEAIISIPKGIFHLHERFYTSCLDPMHSMLEAEAGAILIRNTKDTRTFRNLVSWLFSGPNTLWRELEEGNEKVLQSRQLELAHLYIWGDCLSLDSLSREALETFYDITHGDVSPDVIQYLLELANPFPKVLTTAFARFVLDDVACELFKTPGRLASNETRAARLKWLMQLYPHLAQKVLESNYVAIVRRGQRKKLGYYLKIEDDRIRAKYARPAAQVVDSTEMEMHDLTNDEADLPPPYPEGDDESDSPLSSADETGQHEESDEKEDENGDQKEDAEDESEG
ncbi:hypothetical protein LTR64_003309 [Lithohypha guttulata]|uniref:uncharacterized protein n=1 Tax=Lithohypha guttulata TaxID=1690604 RepID=UPI002DDF44FB|nr:hypothetical protein LTR51_000471 [Lithohypha guttulata]